MQRTRVAERGQGIVEFAVIFPLFVMLIFVMIDGGLLMGNSGRVHHAVSEGARLAATGASNSQIIQRMSDQSNGLIDSNQGCGNSDTLVCIRWYAGPNGEPVGSVGSRVRVAVHYHYYLITPIDTLAGGLGLSDDPHFSVDACAIATLERPAASVGTTAGGDPSC